MISNIFCNNLKSLRCKYLSFICRSIFSLTFLGFWFEVSNINIQRTFPILTIKLKTSREEMALISMTMFMLHAHHDFWCYAWWGGDNDSPSCHRHFLEVSWRPSKEASIHPDLPSAHFNPKSCNAIGRARSRWPTLASDWWSRLSWERGQCRIPEVETSHSWLEFRDSSRVWKCFGCT